MKAIAVIFTLTFCGATFADEDKKTKAVNFFKCIACSEDPVVLEEYKKCAELKPEKIKTIGEDCKTKVMPNALTTEDRMRHICRNEHEDAEKLYDCIKEQKDKENFTDEEKNQIKEFKSCAKKFYKEYC